MDELSHEKKVQYMTIAACVCKFYVSEAQIDLIVSLYDLVLEKKGQIALSDLYEVQEGVNERQNIKERQKLLDKVSKKID